MAQLVVSAVGAAVGFMIGGPAGAQVGWVAGSMVGAYAFAQNQHQEGPRLKDLKITGTDFGETFPWVAGSPRIAGQIIWASNRREHAHTQEQGKGGGGATSTTYTYSVDLLILLSENPIGGVSRVWANNELVFGNRGVKDGLWRAMRVYNGAADQLPDPLYEAAVGLGNAPAYRGRGYVVIENLDLGGGGNIPNLTFEISGPMRSEFNPLLLYQFADYSGIDRSGNGYDINQVVNARFTDGGVVFDGGVSYLRRNFAGGLGLEGNFTVDAHIYVNAFQAQRFPTVFEFTVPDGAFLILRFNSRANPNRFALSGSFAGDALLSDEFPSPGYYHVCVMNRSSVIHLYVNGVRQPQYLENFYALRNATVLTLGNQYSSGGGGSVSSQFDGLIESFRITPGAIYPEGGFTPPDRPLGFGNTWSEQTQIPVQEVVHALMERAGYSASDFDVGGLAALTKPVRALALSQVASTRSALEVLQKSYFFECSAADKIVFKPRSVAPVVRIPFVDLGFADAPEGSDDPLALKMGNDLEQPAQLAVTYANMAGDYNADTQFSDRLVSGQASTQTMQVPLGMLPAEGKAVADALLFDMIASMHSTTLSLPRRYACLEPGDIVEAVARDGRVLRLRIVQIKAKGVFLSAECCLDDVGALDSAAITDVGYITVADPTRVPDTAWEVMDIPILRDADNAAGFYLAAAPKSINYATDQWKGAVATRSWSDLEYQHLLHMPDASVLGTCITALPAWVGGAVFDEASTLEVRVWGQLASTTRAEILLDDRVNAMLVGAEVVRFRNAELLEVDEGTNERSYRLSSFLRGQRGTEWAIAAHEAGERCVLLTTALRRVTGQSNELQAPMQLKVLTSGKLLSSVQPLYFTDTGVGLKPFSVAGLRALVNPEGVHLGWWRRTRLACRYGGAAPVVPLGEASESYRVQVWLGGSLLRTQLVTAPQWLYSTAMRVDDGLLGGELLRFVVAQVSAAVGAGYESSIERECI